jgi:hypothetical protein
MGELADVVKSVAAVGEIDASPEPVEELVIDWRDAPQPPIDTGVAQWANNIYIATREPAAYYSKDMGVTWIETDMTLTEWQALIEAERGRS